MNPQRYLLPVIIAAGLHGALVFFFTDKIPAPPRPPKETPVQVPEKPRIEMAESPEEIGEAGAGKAEPLPSQQDIERPATEDIFTINVTPAAESIKPVLTLPKNFSNLIGTGPFEQGTVGPHLPGVFNLDRVPRATVRPAPAYPGNMRTTDGSVTVEFVVGPTGRVVTADAIKWTHRDFIDPAVRAVLRWRFEPGTINGRKVSFRMAIPIEFIASN